MREKRRIHPYNIGLIWNSALDLVKAKFLENMK